MKRIEEMTVDRYTPKSGAIYTILRKWRKKDWSHQNGTKEQRKRIDASIRSHKKEKTFLKHDLR
jgi:DNA-binding PadR family transcriptional regulator